MAAIPVAAAAMDPPAAGPAPGRVAGAGAAGPAHTAATTARDAGRYLVVGLGQAQREPTGVLAGAVAFVASALASWIFWYPLSWPSRWLGGLIPQGNCVALRPGTFKMYMCSAKVAALTVASSVILIIALFLLRRLISRGVQRLSARLPKETRFLTAPVAATLVFVVAWAGAHYATTGQRGLLPQNLFPAVVGLFTYVVTRYGAGLKRWLDPVFVWRDRFKRWQRYALAIAIPLVVSLVITAQSRVTRTALKEQVVVLVALVAGYLVMTPRDRQAAAAPALTRRDRTGT